MKTPRMSPRQQAYRIVALQMAVAGIVAIGWLFSGWAAAISAALGGLAAVLPSLYFAYRFFAATYARQVGRIIQAFYWGELTKIVLSAVLVILISRCWPKMALLPFFSGFVVAFLGFWLAPLVMRNRV